MKPWSEVLAELDRAVEEAMTPLEVPRPPYHPTLILHGDWWYGPFHDRGAAIAFAAATGITDHQFRSLD